MGYPASSQFLWKVALTGSLRLTRSR